MAAWSGSDDTESLRSLQRAIDLGCNFFGANVSVERSALSGLLEGAFDERQTAFGLLAQELFLFAALALSGVQLVGDGQSGKDRGLLRVHRAGGVRNDAHFFIDVSGKFLYVGGIEIPRDGIRLPEDLNSGG